MKSVSYSNEASVVETIKIKQRARAESFKLDKM